MKTRARVLLINNLKESKEELKKIGASLCGVNIMAPKALHRVIKIEGVSTKAANIIKQEMLAKGGEVAVSYEAISSKKEFTDILIMGTCSQYKRLFETLKGQPFGVPQIGIDIKETLGNFEKKECIIKIGKKIFKIGKRTYIMGILNITPDSFSDGGAYYDKNSAIRHAVEMVQEGADIIDIGGESTRPGSESVSVDEELRRVIPVIETLKGEIDVPISIDTYKSKVAKEAINSGADMVNDITGLRFDSDMAEVVAKKDIPVVVMHILGTPKTMQENPRYKDVISDVMEYLKDSINIAVKAGIDKNNIIVDPGIGFGKTVEHNLEILRRLREFKSLGKPILIGTSRKSFIGKILDLPVDKRVEGTAATVALAIASGADLIRVHDVGEMIKVAKVTDAISRGSIY